MKRYIRSAATQGDHNITKLDFTIEVVMGDPNQEFAVAAAIEQVPDNVLHSSLPEVKKGQKLGVQALADYNAFIDSVEGLVEDYYDLKIYYKHQSKDESHYYCCLAKDASGELILDFKLKMRIGTHDAHESKQADFNKKQEKQATQNIAKGVKLKPIYISLVLNSENEDVSTYDEAYLWIDAKIEEKVEIMKRKLKYRK